jgi:tRNA 2-thiouridine synthesizing protein B
MILHTVNKSPFERTSLESCLRVARDGSGVLLIEDGVIGALDGTTASAALAAAVAGKSIYVLGPDLEARGLGDKELVDGVKVVDYGGFVDLALEYHTVQAWI